MLLVLLASPLNTSTTWKILTVYLWVQNSRCCALAPSTSTSPGINTSLGCAPSWQFPIPTWNWGGAECPCATHAMWYQAASSWTYFWLLQLGVCQCVLNIEPPLSQNHASSCISLFLNLTRAVIFLEVDFIAIQYQYNANCQVQYWRVLLVIHFSLNNLHSGRRTSFMELEPSNHEWCLDGVSINIVIQEYKLSRLYQGWSLRITNWS